MKLTKPILNGRSEISYSTYFVDSINTIQNKCYNINKRFLRYVESDLFNLEVDTPSFSYLYTLYEEVFFTEVKYKEVLLYRNLPSNIIYIYRRKLVELYNSIVYINSSKSEKQLLYSDLLSNLNMSGEVISCNDKFLKLKNNLSIAVNKYRYHNFIVNFSKVFIREDLYFITRSDFRTRIFPIGRGLHRASGLYKYLLFDKSSGFVYDDKSILYLKEFVSLKMFFFNTSVYSKDQLHIKFTSFFSNYEEKKEEILIFLKSFIDNPRNLNFSDHPDLNKAIKNSKEPSLVLFCLIDYFSYLLDSKYVSFLSIDFDQCSSGPMIYSLLSNDLVMGNLTNVLPINASERNDLYLDFLNRLYKELPLNIKLSKYKDLLLYITDKKVFTRKFSKLLIMPTFYNMGKNGIKDLLYKVASEHPYLRDRIRVFLSIFIPFLEELLLYSYGNTINYQNHLLKTCKFIYDAKCAINIMTLDGSVVRYRYLETITKFGKVYKNNKSYSYRLFLP
jgi:hypothetical protein